MALTDLHVMKDAVGYKTVRSPLRICPLGAHVDHQEGLVTALALDQGLLFHFKPRKDGKIKVRSTQFGGQEEFSLGDVPECDPSSWGAFLRGAVRSLQRKFELKVGLEGVIESALPTGGLSSSAAVSTAYLSALAHVNGISVDSMELIEAAHWIERDFIGLSNGILDHSANTLSRAGSLLFLDCKSRKFDLVPRSPKCPPHKFLLAYSGVSKSLINTGYNERVNECRAAAWYLLELAGKSNLPSFERTTLRSVDKEVYRRYRTQLPARFRRRADHFFSECERVRQGVEAWQSGDLERFGELMTESGQSSIDNYECGSPELISLYEILRDTRGVYGTRFSGAGFRGYCIALVDPAHIPAIEDRVRDEYYRRHPEHEGSFRTFVSDSDNGVELLV